MTAQISDALENRHPVVNFGELALYAITTGDIRTRNGWGEPYRFQNPPMVPANSSICSALWRGYIAQFTLASDGSLTLESYHYTLAPKKPRQTVHERLDGDFWMVMKSDFFGKRVHVPFRAGRIVSDETNWVTEGGVLLESLKHPVRPKSFEARNIPLEKPVFVGTVVRVTLDDSLPEYPRVVIDREIPRIHHFCEFEIRRGNVPIARTKICGSSGGSCGPWALRPPINPMVQIGDELFALSRVPTMEEFEQQMAAESD